MDVVGYPIRPIARTETSGGRKRGQGAIQPGGA